MVVVVVVVDSKPGDVIVVVVGIRTLVEMPSKSKRRQKRGKTARKSFMIAVVSNCKRNCAER